MSDIPNDIVFHDILPRLPTESLLRSRYVCPSWNSSIRQRLPHYLLFVCPDSDDDTTSKPQVFSSPLLLGPEDNTPPPQATHIATIANRRFSEVDAQCDNGLLCMHPKNSSCSEPFVDICNPTTGQIITLPDDPSIRNGFRASTHFGYDPVRNEFKVIRLLIYDVSHEFKISICTVCDPPKSWRPVPVPAEDRSITQDMLSMEDKRGVCVNGAIHWKYSDHILAFDLGSEQFRRIELPPSYREGDRNLRHLRLPDLVQLNGYLTLVRYDFSHLYLTALKNYRTEVWIDITLGSVIGGNEPNPGEEEEEKEPFHFPLCRVPKTGEILLLPHSSTTRHVRAISYDIRRQSRRDAVVMKVPRPLRQDQNSGSVNIFCYYQNPRPLY